MKHFIFLLTLCVLFMSATRCESGPKKPENRTAVEEQARVEQNQSRLNRAQPSPSVSWSMERDELIKRFKLMNERSVVFYMYVYAFASTEPIGYYQVNKVSSVNSQLTNPNQIVISEEYDTPGEGRGKSAHVLPSPAEDGSYGTNGDGVFSFTPDGVYIEHNMQYIVSTVPLALKAPQLATITVETADELKRMLDAIK